MAARMLLVAAAAALCLALQAPGAAAHSLARRDAPAAAGAPGALQEIEKHAAEFQKTFSEQLNSLASSQNTQQLQQALKDGSESVLQQLSALSASLQAALSDANGKAKDALESTRGQVQRAADELRAQHPDVEQHAGQLREQLQRAVQNTVQETQKLAKEVAANVEQTNQKLAPKLKEAYDDFVKQAEEVQKKLHEAATKQ